MAKVPVLPPVIEAELLPETVSDAVSKALMRPDASLVPDGTCLDCSRDATQSDDRCIVHTKLRLPSITPAKRARGVLDGNLLRYAQLHLDAAEKAASKGDAEPSQWALERTGAVEPIEKKQINTGITVMVGCLLPGLKEGFEDK